MLTLERKEGEEVVLTLGETRIEITVAIANYGKTKLQIEAPDEVTIYRKELVSKTD